MQMDTPCTAKTAAEWNALAAGKAQDREDSFARCDTDGFLSQWASGLSAELYRTKATLAEANGLGEFTGLYEGDRRVKARLIITQPVPGHTVYSWLLHEDEVSLIAKRGKKFIPENLTGKSRIQKQLGLSERREMAPADAKFEGRGTGLGGSCWVATYRTGCKWGTDASPVAV